MLTTELADRLRPSTGMRNLLTHEYGRIDLDVVAAAVPVAKRNDADYIRSVRSHLETATESSSDHH